MKKSIYRIESLDDCEKIEKIKNIVDKFNGQIERILSCDGPINKSTPLQKRPKLMSTIERAVELISRKLKNDKVNELEFDYTVTMIVQNLNITEDEAKELLEKLDNDGKILISENKIYLI